MSLDNITIDKTEPCQLCSSPDAEICGNFNGRKVEEFEGKSCGAGVCAIHKNEIYFKAEKIILCNFCEEKHDEDIQKKLKIRCAVKVIFGLLAVGISSSIILEHYR